MVTMFYFREFMLLKLLTILMWKLYLKSTDLKISKDISLIT